MMALQVLEGENYNFVDRHSYLDRSIIHRAIYVAKIHVNHLPRRISCLL